MLSIIIPTKNEEHYLPKLLKSIKKQKFKDYEIIIADGGSKDKTREIAKKYGCRVIIGRKRGSPAIERNKGAKIAKGDILLFLDADTKLPENFLEKNIQELEKRELGIATCFQIADSRNVFDKLYFKFADLTLLLGSLFYPGAYGSCIFIRKKIFDSIKGFDKKIRVWEDHDLANRASKISKYGILRGVKIINSVRRYERFGRIKIVYKNLIAGLYRVFFGRLTNDRFKYTFDYKK